MCFLQADISRKNQGHLTIDYTAVAYLDNGPSTNPESNPLSVHEISIYCQSTLLLNLPPFVTLELSHPQFTVYTVFKCINAVLLCVWKGQQGHSFSSSVLDIFLCTIYLCVSPCHVRSDLPFFDCHCNVCKDNRLIVKH